MLHNNIKIYNNEDDKVKIVVHGQGSENPEDDQVRIIINATEAQQLINWGFKPCTVLDIELWNYPYSFTMLEDGFLGISFAKDLMMLDKEEVELLKVSLYTLLTSGTFATDCND